LFSDLATDVDFSIQNTLQAFATSGNYAFVQKKLSLHGCGGFHRARTSRCLAVWFGARCVWTDAAQGWLNFADKNEKPARVRVFFWAMDSVLMFCCAQLFPLIN
jgi:hypothetical protein